MFVLRFERPRRHRPGKPGYVTALLVAIALWLGYGAAAEPLSCEDWPAIDVAHGLGSNLLFGRDGTPGARWVAIDGDTVQGPGYGRVRVLGVDTPELHSCRCAFECELGQRAKRRTQAFLDSGRVFVDPSGRDGYGRTLADVQVNGRDLARTLLAEGFARSYSGGARYSWCG